MHILLGIDGMHPRNGGPPQVVVGSALALVNKGHTVSILTTDVQSDEAVISAKWPEIESANIEVVRCSQSHMLDLITRPKLQSRVTALIAKADVLHLHGIWSPFLLRIAIAARNAGKHYLVSVHGLLDRWSMKQSAMKKRFALHCVGVKPYLKNAFAVIFGTEDELHSADVIEFEMNEAVVANGTEIPNIGDEQSTAQFKQMVSACPQTADWKRMILFFSRIHHKKGPDILLSAFESIAGDYPETGLLIAGIEQDKSLQKDLEDQANRSQFADQIAITTELSGKKGRYLYQLCDIFVLPSHQEGFSMAILEAMAHAKPVLVTNPCRFPDLEKRGAGVSVLPNVESLARGLRSLLDRSGGELKTIGQAANEIILRNYTWPQIVGQLEILYADAAGATK